MALLDSPALSGVNDQLNQLRAKYYALPERDRLSLIVLSVFLGLVSFYYLVWTPISDNLDSAKQKYDNKASTLQWMSDNETAARQASRQKGKASGGGRQGKSILTLVNQTSQKKNIKVRRVEPKGDDGIRVWLDKVPFNDLMSWLHMLSNQYNITTVNVSFEKQKEIGLVNASVILKG